MERSCSDGDLRGAFEAALASCFAVQLCFVRHRDLLVPEFAMPGPAGFSIFEYGLHLHLPIPDLKIDERGVTATLSFARFPYPTHVPWEAVVGIRGWPAEADSNLRPGANRGLRLVP